MPERQAKPMTEKQAVRLAMAALEQQRHAIAVDAELADKYHATYPAAISASQKRKKINQALEALNGLAERLSK